MIIDFDILLGQSASQDEDGPQSPPDSKMGPPLCEAGLSAPLHSHSLSVPPSPSAKKSFFKKNVEDGMDK